MADADPHAEPDERRYDAALMFNGGLAFTAKRLGRVTLLQMDARSIPYMDAFDVFGAFDVLERIEEDDERVLAKILRALRPGGGIVLTVPRHPWLWSLQDARACHVRRYRTAELRNKVTQGGLRDGCNHGNLP